MTNAADRDAIAFAALDTPRPPGTFIIVIVGDETSRKVSLAVSEGPTSANVAYILATAAAHVGSGVEPDFHCAAPEVTKS